MVAEEGEDAVAGWQVRQTGATGGTGGANGSGGMAAPRAAGEWAGNWSGVAPEATRLLDGLTAHRPLVHMAVTRTVRLQEHQGAALRGPLSNSAPQPTADGAGQPQPT